MRFMTLFTILIMGLAGSQAAQADSIARVPDDLSEVTYSKHISRLIQAKCQECHRPEGIAPFSLMTYRQVKGWSRMIKEVVNERRMPPWGADPNVGHFKNDPSLTKEELAMVNYWVDNGTPRGKPEDMPEPLEFYDEWTIGKPDMVIEMPEEATIKPTGVVPYQYFVTKTDFDEDKYFSALEVLPGNRKVVHHIIIFVRDPDAAQDQRVGFLSDMLDVYAPGSPPSVLEGGKARVIPKGAELVWQVHYTPTGKLEKDRSKFGLVFADGPVNEVIRTTTAVNPDFKIPAHHPNYEVEAELTLPKAATVYSFTPHMHYRGKAMDFIFEYPDGTEKLACSIPQYDFNWQLDYQLAEPLEVPAGTTLRVVGTFDNSADNPYNPDPTKPVTWGEQTWEEMLLGGIFYSWKNEEIIAHGDD